jgi:hypothetical protein
MVFKSNDFERERFVVMFSFLSLYATTAAAEAVVVEVTVILIRRFRVA